MQYPDPFDQMQTRKQALIDKLQGGTATGPTSIAPTTPPPIVGPSNANYPGLGKSPDELLAAGYKQTNGKFNLADLLGGASPMPGGSAPASAPAPQGGLGQYANKLGGWDMGKFADPNKSEKYKIGEVFSRYDPTKGVSPELLAELNALGIADFSGSGDKLSVRNTKNDPRFGTGGTADVISRFNAGDGSAAWSPWFVDEQAGHAAGGTPQFAGSTIHPMLQGDAQGGIANALQNIGQLAQPSRLQQLIAALGGQA